MKRKRGRAEIHIERVTGVTEEDGEGVESEEMGGEVGVGGGVEVVGGVDGARVAEEDGGRGREEGGEGACEKFEGEEKRGGGGRRRRRKREGGWKGGEGGVEEGLELDAVVQTHVVD